MEAVVNLNQSLSPGHQRKNMEPTQGATQSWSPLKGTQEQVSIQVCGLLSSSFHSDATPGNQPGGIPRGHVSLQGAAEYRITMEGQVSKIKRTLG